MTEQAEQTLAAFVLNNDLAAHQFFKTIQKIDEADKNVQIVGAAIADRSMEGKVKVQQVADAGKKHRLGAGAIGVVVGGVLLGPAGAVVGGATGGILAGLHHRLRGMGIDDKFMKSIALELERGKSALFVLYEGVWAGSMAAVNAAIKANDALLIYSTLPPEKSEALVALIEAAAEELGGEEVAADYEVETIAAAPAAPAVEAAPPAVAVAAAVEAAAPVEADDLTKLKGIGPRTAAVLIAAGIDSYAELAGTSEPDLRAIFAEAHVAVPRNVNTWAMQAAFAARGDWVGLDAFNAKSQPARPEPAAEAPAEPDDLTQLSGIGPKAAKALAAAGITTYEALAQANEPQLRQALHQGGMQPPASVASWPMQAQLAAQGDWQGLMKFNQKQSRGKAAAAKPKPAAAEAAPVEPDDLTQISGIGPRMSSILVEGGVTTYAQLEHMTTDELRQIIAVGGALPPSSLGTWPTQAAYAAKGDWQGMAEYNKRH